MDFRYSHLAEEEGTTFNRNNTRYRQISRSIYFGGHQNNLTALYNRSLPTQQPVEEGIEEAVKNYNTKLSRHLPPWAWYVIAACLGIRTHYRWLGIFFFLLTSLLALAFMICFIWFTIYDVKNHLTQSTVLTGTMGVILALYWCALGLYSNRLAKKLFRSRSFVDSVRLHSKRIMKISASALLAIIAFVILGLHSYAMVQTYPPERCVNISVPEPICPVLAGTRIGYSVLNIVWNLLVGIVMLSVCRTHTIGIRRFIKEVEEDGRLYEQRYHGPDIGASLRTTTPPPVPNATMSSAPATSNAEPQSGLRARSPVSVRDVVVDEAVNEYLNELQDTDSERDSVDSEAEEAHFSFPLPSTVCDVDGANTATSFRERRRRYAVRLNSFRGSQTSLNSSRASRNISAAGQHQGSYIPGSLGEAGGRRGTFGMVEPAFATIHSTECIDECETEGVKTQTASPPHRRRHQRTEAAPLIDLEEPPAVDTVAPTGGATGYALVHEVAVGLELPKEQGGCEHMTGDLDDVRCQLCAQKRAEQQAEEEADDIKSEDSGSSVIEPAIEDMMLTNEEILLANFKLQVRLCSSSLALQRWLTMWITFILCWAATFLIQLTGKNARLVDIVEFALSIVIIPLLCSAYGEVNYESKRLIRRICTAPWRIEMLFYMDQMPPQMVAYGTPVTYSAISTTVGALGLAFFTKMILTDVSWTG